MYRLENYYNSLDDIRVKVHSSNYVTFTNKAAPLPPKSKSLETFKLSRDGTKFSGRQRSRLLDLGAALENHARSLNISRLRMVTATIPSPVLGEFYTDLCYSRRFSKFVENARKNYGLGEYFYVVEVQPDRLRDHGQRAIHFHMLCIWNCKIDYPALNEVWENLVREDHYPSKNALDFQVVGIYDNCPVGAYLAKYVSKDDFPVYCRRFGCTKLLSSLAKVKQFAYADFISKFGNDKGYSPSRLKLIKNDHFHFFSTFLTK